MSRVNRWSSLWLVCLLLVAPPLLAWTMPARADETCNSPYMANLIRSQEDFLYVWTLGAKGVGDGSDKLYSNKGDLVATYPMPTANGGDGYGYDIAINPEKNVLLTSSFTGRTNYMMELGRLVKDAEATKRFGKWDGKELTPAFEADFYKEKLGRAHHMKFGSKGTKAAYRPGPVASAR
jgi:hypothetical protein